ncbi:MAG: hypothetical protein KDA35_00375 [Hyphomonadaceae bacterium]|nr:hypothetical protein [Hyphomonadaceae bacterium]
MSELDLITAVYAGRHEQVLLHLKGRDDAVKHFLIVSAALAAASQAEVIGINALLAIPVVALGMAVSFGFHHVYIGVIVCFLRYDLAKRVPEDVPFPEWDRSSAHGESVLPLRFVTLVGGGVVFVVVTLLSVWFYAISDTSYDRAGGVLAAYALIMAVLAGGTVAVFGTWRYEIEKEAKNKSLAPISETPASQGGR